MSPEALDSQEGVNLALERFQIGHIFWDAFDGHMLVSFTVGGQMDGAKGPLAKGRGGRINRIRRGQSAGLGGGEVKLAEGFATLQSGNLGG